MPRKPDDVLISLTTGSSDKLFRVRAKAEEMRRAIETIEALGARKDELAKLPETGLQAVQMVAMQSLPEKLQASLMGDPSLTLTTQQRTAAGLLGQGMSHEDIAMGMEIDAALVYNWDLNVTGFRQEAMRWRDMAEFQLGGSVREKIQVLMEQDHPVDTWIKLLGLADKLGQRPEQRGLAKVKLVMDAEKIKLAREHLHVKSGQVAEQSSAVSAILNKFGSQLMEKGADADKAALEAEFEVTDEELDGLLEADEEDEE